MGMLIGVLSMIIQTVAGFFTMVLLVRTAMRFMRISFVSQLGQFVLATTNWVVNPLQRILPSIGRVDLCSLVPAWLIQVLLAMVLALLNMRSINLAVFSGAAAIVGALNLLSIALMLLSGVVIVAAILSWVNPYAPIVPLLNSLIAPFLTPFRKIMPPISGVDLSPLLLLLVLQILQFVLQGSSNSLLHLF